jgi:putative phosphotransacetylase
LSNGEIVRVRVGRGGDRETVFEKTVVRVSDKFSLELHLDTDEANAAGVKTGDMAYIV